MTPTDPPIPHSPSQSLLSLPSNRPLLPTLPVPDRNLSSSTTPTLPALPDDVLLRIISLTGPPGVQIGAAYRLGAVSVRFRRLLHDHFLTAITKLSNDCLTALCLSDSSAACLALTRMFAATSAVKELDFGACSPSLLRRESIQALAVSAKDSLVKVNFAYCAVTDCVVSPLLQCSSLRSLSLFSCDGFTGLMFMDQPVVAPLEFLDLSWVHTLKADGVKAIAQIPTIQKLIFTGCEQVNTRTLRAFATSDIRMSLRCMTLSYCPVKNSTLFELLGAMPNLRSLILAEYNGNLWATGNFTAVGIEELRTRFPRVQIRFTT